MKTLRIVRPRRLAAPLALVMTSALSGCVSPTGGAAGEDTESESTPVDEAPSSSGGAGAEEPSPGAGGLASGGSASSSGGSGGGATQPTGTDVCSGALGTAPSGMLSATQIEAANAESNTNYHLLEGPVWLDGALHYSHFSNQTASWPSQIKRLNGDGTVDIVVDASGSNGLALDGSGALLAATHDQKEIARFEPSSAGSSSMTRTTVVGEYLDLPFNAPNDLAVSDTGDIYFTDPDSDQKNAAPGGQERARVYHWDGEAVHVVDDSFKPNGIAISPDGAFLYVSGGGYSGKLVRYPLVDGAPGAGEDVMPLAEPDGIAFDCLGNLYATEHVSMSNRSRVRVFDPEGTEIAEIAIGPATGVGYSDVEAKATNVTFGGPEGKTLFITASFSLWQIELNVAGQPG